MAQLRSLTAPSPLPLRSHAPSSFPAHEDAYVCSTKGFTLIKAVMSWAKSDAYFNWPSLPLMPPLASVKSVPHEGGPGPQLTCFAGQLS